MTLFRLPNRNLLNFLAANNSRAISTTLQLRVKEIKVEHVGDTLEISGVHKESPRADTLIKQVKEVGPRFCPKCTLGLNIKHTDVLILSQYIQSDGSMLPRTVTRLCSVQHKNIETMIKMAQQAGLMKPNTAPLESWMEYLPGCKGITTRDLTKRYGWRKFNQYYDEKTITYRKRPINDC